MLTKLTNAPRLRNNDLNRLQIPTSSHRHFSSLARRLGRIFAHAYFHHREAFEQAEAESSLYARFLSLSSKFDLVPDEFLVIPANTPIRDGDEDRNGESGGFGSREVKLGTSYDPRRSVSGGGSGGMQYQLQRPFHDEFLAVQKMKRLPQQYQQFPHQPQSPQQQQQQQHESQQIQRQPKLSPLGGAESPRKTGRNRTHTMVLSEAAQVADELAKVTAAANVRAEKEEREIKEKEAKAREELESEQRQRDEAESEAKQEMEEPTSDEPKDIDEGVTETAEENVSDGERFDESTGNVVIEEESAVEVLHVTPESEPTGKEPEPEETDANPTKVGEESGMQEVDIATASIATEALNVEDREGSFEADVETEVKEDRKEAS